MIAVVHFAEHLRDKMPDVQGEAGVVAHFAAPRHPDILPAKLALSAVEVRLAASTQRDAFVVALVARPAARVPENHARDFAYLACNGGVQLHLDD